MLFIRLECQKKSVWSKKSIQKLSIAIGEAICTKLPLRHWRQLWKFPDVRPRIASACSGPRTIVHNCSNTVHACMSEISVQWQCILHAAQCPRCSQLTPCIGNRSSELGGQDIDIKKEIASPSWRRLQVLRSAKIRHNDKNWMTRFTAYMYTFCMGCVSRMV